MNSQHPITLIPGDGIGPEVVASVEAVLAAAEVPIIWDRQIAGAEVFKKGLSSGVPPETIESIRRNKIALKGPLETPVGFGEKSANVTLRKYFETYGNIRPVRELPGIRTPYSGRGIDFIVVRDNIEDLYAGIEHMQTPRVAQALKLITKKGSEKICRLAFELARSQGRRSVHCATKANILKLTEGLFKKVFEDVAKDYPEILAEHMIVDNCAHQMVLRPEQFDVIVMTNMNGDILSDLASALIGGLGFAPSGNLGDEYSIFEAVHGSAPSIAGKDIANPTAILQSAVMMLRHLGELSAADAVENGLLATLEEGKNLTPDIAGDREPGGTKSFTKQVIANLGRKPKSYPQRIHQKIKMPHLVTSTTSGTSQNEKVIGIDVFIAGEHNAQDLAKELNTLSAGLKVTLSLISNRGMMVYPDFGADPDTVDCWRCRIKTLPPQDVLSDQIVLELLQRISKRLRWVHVEKLQLFDDIEGFTKAQGEK
jgi:isocitrate dehydrogenase